MTVGQALQTFALPADLASQGFRLRPETDADTPFLMRLYASTREEELRPVPWSDEEREAFLVSQFQAQRHHYRTHIPGCSFDVLERHGKPMGRLYLQARQTQLHIVDIALSDACRGRGIGTAILKALQTAAGAQGKGVGIFVEKFNIRLVTSFGERPYRSVTISLKAAGIIHW